MLATAFVTRATIVTLLCLSLAACERQAPAGQTRDTRGNPVAVTELSTRDLSRRVLVSAPIEPRVHIRLASRTSGTVRQVHREEGDHVIEGELLAELDMSEQRAELARAVAEEERARLDYQRMLELRNRDVISPAEYQRIQANLRIAESERELWQTRVNFGHIQAPQAAVITARHIEPGEAVQAQDTLFELSALDQLVMYPGLSELDVVHIHRGQTLPVKLDALPELQLEGEVRRIFPAANVGSRLITIEVALPPDAAEQGVKPGFLARLEFDVDRQTNVSALPSIVVGNHSERGYYVYVVEDGRLAHRAVTPGVSRGGWTQIIDGLEPGELVLASNPIDMRDGQQVRIVEHRKTP